MSLSSLPTCLLINCVLASTALASTQRAAKAFTDQAGKTAAKVTLSAGSPKRKPPGKQMLGKKTTKAGQRTIGRKEAKKATSDTPATTLETLQAQLVEVTGAIAALTKHDVAISKAPKLGTTLSHKAFFDLGGRATIGLEGAADGEIYSVDGQWHTVDFRTADYIRSEHSRSWGGGDTVVETTDVSGGYAPTPSYVSYMRRVHHQFATHPHWKLMQGMYAGFARGYEYDVSTANPEVRRAKEQYAQPSLRIFRNETGAKAIKIKRVGKVFAERIMRAGNNYQPVLVPAEAQETFKFMPIIGLRGDVSKLELSFLSHATGVESIVGTLTFRDKIPLVYTASEDGVYIARSVRESSKSVTQEHSPIYLRVEQAYVAQTPEALADEFFAFDSAIRGVGQFAHGISEIHDTSDNVLDVLR